MTTKRTISLKDTEFFEGERKKWPFYGLLQKIFICDASGTSSEYFLPGLYSWGSRYLPKYL